MELDQERIKRLIENALAEDQVYEDITSRLLIPGCLIIKAVIFAGEEGVLAGADICRQVLLTVDRELKVDACLADGTEVNSGDEVLTVFGHAAGILAAERTALNFLGHLSGIATLTARFVSAIQGTRAVITDTRKTTPGLRGLEKMAVRAGGGHNHRLNLSDRILIKDNHLSALKSRDVSLGQAVRQARAGPSNLLVEVEVATVKEAEVAARAGADMIMLDNMGLEEMRRAAKNLSGRVKLEASGGINLANVREVAETGVDYISIGALTHSAASLDFSLELLPD